VDDKDQRWHQALTWAFYDYPTQPVRVTHIDLPDDARHLLLLKIWAQAWPDLRAGISFADAPKTPRALNERPFDLQLHMSARIERSDRVRILRRIPEQMPPRWVGRLASESYHPSGLSRFLSRYGAELADDRGGLSFLVSIFTEHETEAPDLLAGGRVLDNIVAIHRSSSSGKLLKREVMRPAQPPAGCSRKLDEVVLLRALVSTDAYAAFAGLEMRIEQRTQALLKDNIQDAQFVLKAIEDEQQPFAASYLTTLVEELSLTELGELVRRDLLTLDVLARQSPALLHAQDIWRLVDAEHLWLLAAPQRGSEQRFATLAAAIGAQAQLSPESVLSRWRNSAPLVLRALTTTKAPRAQVRRWLRAIPPDDVVSYFTQADGITLDLFSLALEEMPAKTISKMPPERVLSVARDSKSSLDQVAAAFAAALKRTSNPEWAEIAVSAYGRIAKPAREGRLGKAKGRLDKIESALPRSEVLTRVAAALNRGLLGEAWASVTALGLDDRKAFRALLEADANAELARSILVEAAGGDLSLEPWQHAIITKTIADRSDRASIIATLEEVGRALLRKLR
jgi:hypothetical protein